MHAEAAYLFISFQITSVCSEMPNARQVTSVDLHRFAVSGLKLLKRSNA
jgi:hypothetical protein